MAKKQQDPEEQKQAETEGNVNVPEGVVPTPGVDRGSYFKLAAAAKDFIKKYNFTDFTQFHNAVLSDGRLAGLVIDDLLAEKFGDPVSAGIGVSPDSPQENNVTGRLEHTSPDGVAKKVITEAQTEVPPPVTVDLPEGTATTEPGATEEQQ